MLYLVLFKLRVSWVLIIIFWVALYLANKQNFFLTLVLR